MFSRETVFILGAGASWHYCYPTGEQLVVDIIEVAKALKNECQRHLDSRFHIAAPAYAAAADHGAKRIFWQRLSEECHDLVDRLETVRPPVIDYFLGWNPSLRNIGKLLIAAVMLKCEADYFSAKANTNRRRIWEQAPNRPSAEELRLFNVAAFKDNWYRFVTYRIASECSTFESLLENKVRFVTFNYDYSLENHLFRSLGAIDTFKGGKIDRFISEDRIVHVYGCIRDAMASDEEIKKNGFLANSLSGWTSYNESDPRDSKWIGFLDACEAASRKIRTIDSHDKTHEPTFEIARKWIAAASDIYILGYGFDETNGLRIGLSGVTKVGVPHKNIYFTNFNNINSVNKKVGGLVGHYRTFLQESMASGLNGNSYEKSTRDVYEALELDFGLV